MLYTLSVFLMILWLLGMVTSTTLGGYIHILIVIAAVIVVASIIGGRDIL